MDVLVLLGNRIRQLRKNLKLTQSGLAEKSGLSTNFIALLEKGKRSASVDTLYRISKVLKIELKELFVFPEKMTKAQLAADDLMKFLKKRSADDIIMIKDIAGVILEKKGPSRK
jgi:transcriptional regulator with XRE-family HTH domain